MMRPSNVMFFILTKFVLCNTVYTHGMEFEWDKGNSGKNLKHSVADEEAEQSFFDPDNVLRLDLFHSQHENRYVLLGKTSSQRLLYISYTVHKDKVRIISARDVNQKERQLYEKTT